MGPPLQLTVVAWAIFVAALCSQVVSQTTKFSEERDIILAFAQSLSNHHPLRKKAYSNNVRLIIVAGLEGTGHHGLKEMFKHCAKQKLCFAEESITHAMMHNNSHTNVLEGLFSVADVGRNAQLVLHIFERMKYLASATDQHVQVLGLGMVGHSGMLSYPNYIGVNKTLNHPDVLVLAALAELANLDLRILVIQREAAEILRSTSNRPEIHGGALEPYILVDNAAALYAQLSMIDSKFFHCLSYRSLGSLSTSERESLADFIHPVTMPKVMLSMLKRIQYSSPSINDNLVRNNKVEGLNISDKKYLEMLDWEYHTSMLAARLNLVYRLCVAPSAKPQSND